MNPLSRKCATDYPTVPIGVEFSLTIDLQHPRTHRVLPTRRLRLVAARAFTPERRWCLHAQSLIRSHMVVFPPIRIQPGLRVSAGGVPPPQPPPPPPLGHVPPSLGFLVNGKPPQPI